MIDILYIINSSLCKHCENRVSRVISVEGLYVQYEDAPSEGDLSDVEDFIHESCSMLCIDLDHIVLDCNKFKEVEIPNDTKSLIKTSDIIDELS